MIALNYSKYLLLFFTLLTMVSCSTNEITDLSKYSFVTTINDFDRANGLGIGYIADYEKMSRTKYIDGVIDIEYEYDNEASGSSNIVYYSVTVEKSQSTRDAQMSFGQNKTIFSGYMKFFGDGTKLEEVEKSRFDLNGITNAYIAYITNQGFRNGMIISLRKDKINYYIIFAGAIIDDITPTVNLIKAKLEQASTSAF